MNKTKENAIKGVVRKTCRDKNHRKDVVTIYLSIPQKIWSGEYFESSVNFVRSVSETTMEKQWPSKSRVKTYLRPKVLKPFAT